MSDKLIEILQTQVVRLVDARDAERLLRDRAEKERDEALAKLKKIRCIFCNAEYRHDQSGELADHIMSCEKSPLVQMVHNMESRLTDYADMMLDELQRIVALTDDSEIRGICQRAMTVTRQKEPVISQRDKAERERDEAQRACAEMRRLLERICPETDKMAELLKHCFSTDCGKGWVRASELENAALLLTHAASELRAADPDPELAGLCDQEIRRLEVLLRESQ